MGGGGRTGAQPAGGLNESAGGALIALVNSDLLSALIIETYVSGGLLLVTCWIKTAA